jgi:hypothetical protein
MARLLIYRWQIGKKTKSKTESNTMKIELLSKPGDKARQVIPVTVFRFESHPIPITRGSRCVSGVAISQTKSQDLRRRALGRVIP